MSATGTTVIKVEGGRFYCGKTRNGRLKTAWSMAAATHFLPDDYLEIQKAFFFVMSTGREAVIVELGAVKVREA